MASLSPKALEALGWHRGFSAARFSDWPETAGGVAWDSGQLDRGAAFEDLAMYAIEAERGSRTNAPASYMVREISALPNPAAAWRAFDNGVVAGAAAGASARLGAGPQPQPLALAANPCSGNPGSCGCGCTQRRLKNALSGGLR